MPFKTFTVRDKKSGESYKLPWDKSKPPSREEVRLFLDEQRRVKNRSGIEKAWDWANEPLTDMPSRITKEAATKISTPRLSESEGSYMPYVRGFGAGALEGVGNLVSSMTSPAGLASIAATGGAAGAARGGLVGTARALSAADIAMSGATAAHGGVEMGRGLSRGEYGRAGQGAIETVLGTSMGALGGATMPTRASILAQQQARATAEAAAAAQRATPQTVLGDIGPVRPPIRPPGWTPRATPPPPPPAPPLFTPVTPGEIAPTMRVLPTGERVPFRPRPTAAIPDIQGPPITPDVIAAAVPPPVRKTAKRAVRTPVVEKTPILKAEPTIPTRQTGRLPDELRGAAPRYRQHEPDFESDIDRALYIVAQKNPSKRNADYLKFVMDETGMDAATAVAEGIRLRSHLKTATKGQPIGKVRIPTYWKAATEEGVEGAAKAVETPRGSVVERAATSSIEESARQPQVIKLMDKLVDTMKGKGTPKVPRKGKKKSLDLLGSETGSLVIRQGSEAPRPKGTIEGETLVPDVADDAPEWQKRQQWFVDDAERMRREHRERPFSQKEADERAEWKRRQENSALYEGRNINDIRTPLTATQQKIRDSYKKLEDEKMDYATWFSEQESLLPEDEFFKPPKDVEAAHRAKIERMTDEHEALVKRLTGGLKKEPLPDIDIEPIPTPKQLTSKIPDIEGPPGAKIELLDEDSMVNASGESAASAEAISRQRGMGARGEQFAVKGPGGQIRPLIGPEAVDYQPRPGETYGKLDKDGNFSTLQKGEPRQSAFKRLLKEEKGALNISLRRKKKKYEPRTGWRQDVFPLTREKVKGEPKDMTIFRGVFQDWVNSRNAGKVAGTKIKEEFKDLRPLGIQAIQDYQQGNRTGKLSDVKDFSDRWERTFSRMRKKPKMSVSHELWDNTDAEIVQALGTSALEPVEMKFDTLLKTYTDGIATGKLKPKHASIGELASLYEGKAVRKMANIKFRKEMQSQGLVIPAKLAKSMGRSVVPITATASPVKGHAQPYVARAINNYLGESSKPTQILANVAQGAKNLALAAGVPGTGFSGHGINMIVRNTASRGMMSTGKQLIQSLKWAANTGAETLPARIIEKIAPWESARKSMLSNLDDAEEFVRHGMTLSSEDFVFQEKGKVWEALDKLGFSKATDFHTRVFEDPLFQNVVPAMKIDFAKQARDKMLAAGVDATTATRQAAVQANDMFGGMNWDEVGASKDFMNLMRAVVLAPDWATTHIRHLKGASNWVKNPKDPRYQGYGKLTSGVAGLYVAGNVLNYMNSGHFMFQNDPGQTFNIEMGKTKNAAGEERKRYLNMFGTAADFYRLPTDIAVALSDEEAGAMWRMARGRLSLPASAIGGAVYNVDRFNRPLSGVDAFGRKIPLEQQVANYTGQLATPFTPQYVKPLVSRAAREAGGKGYGQPLGPEEMVTQMFELPIRHGSDPSKRRSKKKKSSW